MARNWRDVRAEANLDESVVAAERARLLAEVRAHRLAEVRARHQLTQEQLAARMGVSQARVSKIEKGELPDTEIGTVEKYVRALGGVLRVVVEIDGEFLVLN